MSASTAGDCRENAPLIIFPIPVIPLTLRRPVDRTVSVSGGSEKLLRRIVYGDLLASPATTNHVGRVYRVYDGAGVATTVAFDFNIAADPEGRAMAQGRVRGQHTKAQRDGREIGEALLEGVIVDLKPVESAKRVGDLMSHRRDHADRIVKLVARAAELAHAVLDAREPRGDLQCATTCDDPAGIPSIAHVYGADFRWASLREDDPSELRHVAWDGLAKPTRGTYAVVGRAGVVAELKALRSVIGDNDSVQIEFGPTPPDLAKDGPYVVIGPVDSSPICARLMRVGQGRLGLPASARAESGSRPFPEDTEPLYAVDLDADGAADLTLHEHRVGSATYRMHGAIEDVPTLGRSWAFVGGSWRELDSREHVHSILLEP